MAARHPTRNEHFDIAALLEDAYKARRKALRAMRFYIRGARNPHIWEDRAMQKLREAMYALWCERECAISLGQISPYYGGDIDEDSEP